jgi:hypothetical protein
MLGKSVVMGHAPERTRNHHVLKVSGTVESGNSNSESLPHSEMPSFPCHLPVHANKPFRYAGDSTLFGSSGGVLVRVNATSKVKHSFSRGMNHGG